MRTLLLLLVAARARGAGPFLPQQHSFNDLRQLPQALAKAAGAVAASAAAAAPLLLKLDPQYAPPAFCATQARVNASRDPRGCLLLNHDSVGASSRRDLNSTADLLALLASPALAAYSGPQSPGGLVVSLCFKGCGGLLCPCDGAIEPATASWLSLVDELVAAAAAAVAAGGLRVEFVLDGDGNPGAAACLAQRWRPLTSVFITGGDPPAAFNSSNASAGYDRLQTLNDDDGHFPRSAAAGFGKFARGARPVVVWEPSEQATMLAMGAAFAAAPAQPAAGMRWAINTDVAQWATYTANITQTAWGAPLVTGNASWSPGNSSVAAVRAPAAWAAAAASLTARFVGAAVYPAGAARALIYELWLFNTTAAPSPAILSRGSLALRGGGGVPPGAAVHASWAALADGTLLLLVDVHAPGADTSELGVYVVAPAPGGLSVTPVAAAGGAQPLPGAATLHASAVVPCSGGGGDAVPAAISSLCRVWLAAIAGDDACSLRAGFGPLAAAAAWQGCLVAPASPPLTLASVALGAAGYDGGSAGTTPRVALAAAYASSDGVLHGAVLCADAPLAAAPTRAPALNDPLACFGVAPPAGLPHAPGTAAPLAAYPGRHAGIALAALPGSGGARRAVAFLAVSDGGWCANNERDNKRDDLGLCDVPPPLGAGGGAYLGYHTGTLAAWALQLLGAEPALWRGNSSGGASPCSALVATGMFGMGNSPAPALLVDAGAAGGGAAATVLGLVTSNGAARPDDTGACGAPVPAPRTLQLDAWPLPAAFYAGPAGIGPLAGAAAEAHDAAR